MTAINDPLETGTAPLEGAVSFGADALEIVTAKRREVANADAVNLAQQLETEGRAPTPDERRVLLAYSGVGGTTSSHDAAEGNTLGFLNEYYTPFSVARAIWALLNRIGFLGGSILEPSAGTGVFLETAPEGVQFTAVELNPDAARINRLLHPDAAVRHSSFEADNHRTDELEFDLVIGNPPFGARGLNALEDKPQYRSYAPYFLDAGLDRLRDGGLLAFVIPSGLMDATKHLQLRANLLARARLRALVRLPISTFEASGARAATDVIVLEKRPWVMGDTLAELVRRFDPRILASAGVLDTTGRDFLQGQFYASRAEHVLGKLVADGRWGGLVCEGDLETAMPRLAATAILESPRGATSLGGLHKTLESSRAFAALAEARGKTIRASLEAGWRQARATGYPHREDLERADGRVFAVVKRDGCWTRGWHERALQDPTLESAFAVARALDAFHTARLEGNAEVAEGARLEALSKLECHLEGHGNPHAGLLVPTAARTQPVLYRLLGAVRADGGIAPQLLASLVSVIERSPDLETLCRRLDNAKRLTAQNILEHWEDGSRVTARAVLLEGDAWALLPDGRFTAGARYECGDVLEKAALARAQAEVEPDFDEREKLLRQADRLESLKPQRTLEEIDLSGTEGWIPVTAIQAWLEQDYPHLEYARDESSGRVTVTIDLEKLREARLTKTQAEDDQKLLSRFFNLEHTAKVVTDAKQLTPVQYAAARKARIEEAQERERALGLKFRHFVSSDPELRESLESRYRALFDAFLVGEDDTRPLELIGWSGPVLHGYQCHGVRFNFDRANALLAFDTGLGKTYTGIATTESLLESGRASRVLIVVPKGLLVNWSRNLETALPFRRVLTVGLTARGEDDVATALEKLHGFALGAFEILLISREWFRRLALRPENLRSFIAQEAALLAADDAEDPYGLSEEDERDPTERQRTLTLAERQAALAGRLYQGNALPLLHFEDLGADALIVDEAGSLKNLYAAPTYFGKKPKFMGASLESDRAIDTLFKVKALHAGNGSRNVVYLTATPTKNSPLELFNILKPLAGEAFSRLGIFGPAQFVERYCLIETVLYPNATGELEAVPGVVGFKNLQELRGLMSQFILSRTAEDVGLRIPDLETFEHVFELTARQQAIYHQLRLEAQIALSDPHGEHGIHLFGVYARMRLLTLEPSLYAGVTLPNPRFEVAARLAVESVNRGGKLVCFMDVGNASEEDEIGSRRKKSGVDAYDLLKNAMVHAGIPSEWIAIVTADRVKGSKRQSIADDYNAGKLRVIIGSTGTIGEGFDLQVGTTDLVHLDIPWDPGTFHQRVGRGHRQGNDAATVRNHILLARGSFDGLTYAMMRGKRGWQEQLWRSGEDTARNSAVLSYDEILAALSDDPDAARLEIERKRADIEAQKREARRQMSLTQFRLYLETLDHQTLAWQKVMGRKKGATANDHKLKGDFERQLERYRQSLHDDASFEYAALLDGRACLVTRGGAVFGSGVVFALECDGQPLEWRVEAVGFIASSDGKWVKASRTDLEAGQVLTFRERELEGVTATRPPSPEPLPTEAARIA